MKFLHTKPRVKKLNINYYDLYYTDIKTRDKNMDIDNQFEDEYNDFITPNHYVGIKPRETILRWVEKFEISDKSFQNFYPL